MAKDKDDTARHDDPAPRDSNAPAEAAAKAERSARDNEELEEGLDESFPGSDAPASTRRSSKD